MEERTISSAQIEQPTASCAEEFVRTDETTEVTSGRADTGSEREPEKPIVPISTSECGLCETQISFTRPSNKQVSPVWFESRLKKMAGENETGRAGKDYLVNRRPKKRN